MSDRDNQKDLGNLFDTLCLTLGIKKRTGVLIAALIVIGMILTVIAGIIFMAAEFPNVHFIGYAFGGMVNVGYDRALVKIATFVGLMICLVAFYIVRKINKRNGK